MGVLHYQSSNLLLAGVRAGSRNWEKIEDPKWSYFILPVVTKPVVGEISACHLGFQ